MNAQVRPKPVGRRELCNALRFLAIDAVEAANSGHPGMPLGMADIAEVVWRGHLKHNPADPLWPDRDRFVLSNGHGSMLLYALLHLTGYALPLEELKRFRQLHSKTPGHPEVGVTPGVETTTGPLGQGLANAVGMALAESLLAAEFNRPGHAIVDHRTWVFVGDGCLMEGISHEACSLAGTLGLSKLVAIYDDNGISIDGHVEHWFTDDTPARFEAYGWRGIRDVPGHDSAAIEAALGQACKEGERPTLVCCKTVIGHGSPHKADTHEVHGAALGAAEVAATRAHLGWTAVPFEIPPEIRAAWDATTQGAARHTDWRRRFAAYAAAHPELAAEFERRVCRRELPAHWQDSVGSMLAAAVSQAAAIASRKASQNVIEALQPLLPELLGGSADLTGSNLTATRGSVAVRRGRGPGNHINYGVREFGMSALMNGIALHGGYLPYGGTFLTFSDYSRNAVRMSALMRQRVIYVFTHDSIGLGEDGPTHQPVEHAARVLHRLVRRAVLAEADAVVREHVDHALAHEGRDALGVAAVVREGEEGTAVGQVAAVQRDAVHERAHAELAHAVVDVVAGAAAAAHGDAAARGRQIRARQVGGAAEQLGEQGLQRLDHVLRRLARGDRRRLGDRRCQHASDAVLPVRRQLAPAHAALELGRELGMGRGVGGKAAPPVGVARDRKSVV